MIRPAVFFLISVGLVLLSSCSGGSKIQTDIAEYQRRLANILDLSINTDSQITSLNFPELNLIRYSIPETLINLPDFYAIQDCQLGILVAQRNTALGKIQLPSFRYVYEVQLLNEMHDCIAAIEDQKQSEKLQQWILLKQQQLPKVWANLIQTSKEIRQQISANQGLISGDQRDKLEDVTTALDYLNSLYHNPVGDTQILEAQLDILRQNTLLANSWRTQNLLMSELKEATVWLQPALELLNCDTPQHQQQATYLANVFEQFFINRIQPLAGQLNYYHYEYSPILRKLKDKDVLRAPFTTLLDSQLGQFEDYKQAMREHVELWQGLFKRCGLSPKPSQ